VSRPELPEEILPVVFAAFIALTLLALQAALLWLLGVE